MFEDVSSGCTQTLVSACWRQWKVLVGDRRGPGERGSRSVIDPEALVVASLDVRTTERRLQDRLLWWAQNGSKLLSVQRLQSIAGLFPDPGVAEGIRWFASSARDAGDGRWKRLADTTSFDEPARSGKGPQQPCLVDASTLMLRLRAGFGVGAKVDVLSLLISSDIPLDREAIAWAISYSRASISRAVSEMRLGEMIQATSSKRPSYSVDARRWSDALRLHPDSMSFADDRERRSPHWRPWGHAFSFLSHVRRWADDALTKEVAPVVSASRARDLTDRFLRFIETSGLQVPDSRDNPGERFLTPFAELVRRVREELDRSA